MRRSEAQKPKTFRTLLFDEGPPEAQNPKTFRIATFFAQKIPDEAPKPFLATNLKSARYHVIYFHFLFTFSATTML